jgi:hypothetical protein
LQQIDESKKHEMTIAVGGETFSNKSMINGRIKDIIARNT